MPQYPSGLHRGVMSMHVRAEPAGGPILAPPILQRLHRAKEPEKMRGSGGARTASARVERRPAAPSARRPTKVFYSWMPFRPSGGVVFPLGAPQAVRVAGATSRRADEHEIAAHTRDLGNDFPNEFE